MNVAYIIVAILICLIFFCDVHIVFTTGRIYECSIVIRELDEKIDETIREIQELDELIERLSKGVVE